MTQGVKKRLIGYPVLILVIYLGSCLVMAYLYVKPIRIVPKTPESLSDVLIPTHSGEDPAWVTRGLANGGYGAGTVFVMAHGFGGTRAAWRGIIEQVHAAGYDAVAPAMPGQDASPDRSVGFGQREAQVIVDTVAWVKSRYPANRPPKIVLLGVSMGGAACWLASEKIPDQVDAVITEGAFSRFDRTVDQWFESIVPGGSRLLRPVAVFSQWISGVDPTSIVPVNAAAKWRKPALVIQAESDTVISRQNAVELSQAAHCPLWIVPHAVHAGCFEAGEKAYLAKISGLARDIDHR